MKTKKNRGITLIALIVTIIILLILVGITISVTLGKNGIINMAQKSKENYISSGTDEMRRLEDLYSSILVATNDDAEINISVKDLKAFIREEVKNAVWGESVTPIGTIIAQMGNSTPLGYINCDGATYNISEYKTLAEYIKTQFGSYNYFGGDGERTFAVPDLREKFLKGSNNGGIVQQAGLPNINGEFRAYGWNTGNASGAFKSTIAKTKALGTGSAADYNWIKYEFNASNSNSIYGKSTTVTPENISVMYCIKY